MRARPKLTCHPAAAGSVKVDTDPFFAIYKNFELKGSLVGSMDDTQRALDFARRVSCPSYD